MGVPSPTERGADQLTRDGAVVAIEGLNLSPDFELRDTENERVLYHNPCGKRIAVFSLHAGPDTVSKTVDEHWCPMEGQGAGSE